MKVLHVTSTFPRHDDDTTGPFLADLALAEQDAGIEVRVLVPHAAGLSRSGLVRGVEVRRFRYGPARTERLAYGAGLLASTRSASGLAQVPPFLTSMIAATAVETRRWRPDVVHAHWWFPGGLAAALGARAAGRPYVVTLHGSDVALAKRRGLRSVAKWVVGGAADVVAVSEALAGEAESVLSLPPGQVGVAAMPVVVPPPTTPRRIPDGPLRLVAVGRLAPEKGFDVLLDALSTLGVDFSLDVLGEGPMEPDLRRRAANLPVTFRGAVPRREYHAIVRDADALVAPSRREGLGLVAVEAVLLGTPVVASSVGGLPSVLGAGPGSLGRVPGGWLVPPEDPPALAAALRGTRALGPPGPEAVAAAARHSPEAVAARHLSLYQAAVAH